MTQTPDRAATPKLFVLDTNVILHDSGCIRNFEENDVAIPITVLEELDQFKRGNEDINFQAREFLRRIDALTGDVLAPAGCPLGPGLGSIRVLLGSGRRGPEAFFGDTPDHRILRTTLDLQHESAPRQVILVSKDTNLRMKAKSLGLRAQDYTSDKVEGFDKLYTGRRLVEGVESEAIDRLYANGGVLPSAALTLSVPPRANENFVLRNGSKSALATFRRADDAFHRVEKLVCYGITPRNAEQSFALKALTDDSIKLVTLAGTAGTGKTLLALAAALECRQRYRQGPLAPPRRPAPCRAAALAVGPGAGAVGRRPAAAAAAVVEQPTLELLRWWWLQRGAPGPAPAAIVALAHRRVPGTGVCLHQVGADALGKAGCVSGRGGRGAHPPAGPGAARFVFGDPGPARSRAGRPLRRDHRS